MKQVKHKLTCRKCGGEIRIGRALIPTWGRLDGRPIRGGETLNMTGVTSQAVHKCKKCGHSFA